MAKLNGAELKVVLYILMHTWGYQEYGIAKHITLDEFKHGRLKKDGTRMDNGTGLSHGAVVKALKKAMEDNFIVCYVDNTDGGRIQKYYMLRMNPHVPAETFAIDKKTGKRTDFEEWLKMAAYEGDNDDNPDPDNRPTRKRGEESDRATTTDEPRCIKSDTSENQGIEGHIVQKMTANFTSSDDRCIKSEHRTLERNYKKETYKKDMKKNNNTPKVQSTIQGTKRTDQNVVVVDNFVDNSVDNLSATRYAKGNSTAKRQKAKLSTAYHTAEGIGTDVRTIDTKQKLESSFNTAGGIGINTTSIGTKLKTERNSFYHTEGKYNTAGRNIFSDIEAKASQIGTKQGIERSTVHPTKDETATEVRTIEPEQKFEGSILKLTAGGVKSRINGLSFDGEEKAARSSIHPGAVKEKMEDEKLHDLNKIKDCCIRFAEIVGRRNDKFVIKLCRKYKAINVEKQLEVMAEYAKRHFVENPEGFLTSALKEGYQLPAAAKRAEAKVKVTCPDCKGVGYFYNPEKNTARLCSTCGGSGKVDKSLATPLDNIILF
ncbi:hypothetical protein [Fervidicola ferrireducens]|nr:hypothetical protein [Fervidicola ferrireducens]